MSAPCSGRLIAGSLGRRYDRRRRVRGIRRFARPHTRCWAGWRSWSGCGTAPQPCSHHRPTASSRSTALAAAVLLVLAPGAWPVARHVVTIVHEGAHGFAAWATGRQLAGIRLHSDTSGVTVSRGTARPALGMVRDGGRRLRRPGGCSGWSPRGCSAPATRSGCCGCCWSCWRCCWCRSATGSGCGRCWSAGSSCSRVSWWLPAQTQSAFAYLVTWFLLLAAPRPVLELQAMRWRRRCPRLRRRPAGPADRACRPWCGWACSWS